MFAAIAYKEFRHHFRKKLGNNQLVRENEGNNAREKGMEKIFLKKVQKKAGKWRN